MFTKIATIKYIDYNQSNVDYYNFLQRKAIAQNRLRFTMKSAAIRDSHSCAARDGHTVGSQVR